MDILFGILFTLTSVAIPAGIYWLYRKGIWFKRLDWAVYLMAVVVAFFLWEMPVTGYLFLTGEEGATSGDQSVAAALAFAAFIAFTASLWDGGIVVVGLLLVRRLTAAPHFEQFRWAEVGILALWAVIFAFGVETFAVVFDLWVYDVYWWNPALYQIQGRPVVFCATIGWGPIALIFYLLVLWLQAQLQKRLPAPSAPNLAEG